nr:putative ribonuclease H-like domain-containing protein [Tanacetum cinerariifolium]
YDEVFAPVARLEAIRIFLAFASYMGFKVYQMDVKSAFLYGKIDEEVYMSQPLGFIDPKFLKKVYKVVKAFPSRNVSVVGPSNPNLLPYANQDDSQIPSLEDIYEVPNDRIFRSASYDDQGAMADFINLESTMNVSRMPLSRIHSIHPITQLLRDPHSAVQTRSKVNKSSGAHALPVTLENIANKTAGPKEANNSRVLKKKNGDEKLNEDTGSKTNKEQVDQEDQAFLEEVERLKQKENEADDV